MLFHQNLKGSNRKITAFFIEYAPFFELERMCFYFFYTLSLSKNTKQIKINI